MDAAGMTQLDDGGNYRAAFDKLSLETKKLQQLREVLAQKIADGRQRTHLDTVAAQVEQTESELLELMIRVENFAGEVAERHSKLRLPS